MPVDSSLREIRRAVSPRIGSYLARTATSGTVSSLTDARHPVRSSNLQEDLFAGKWILRPDAPDEDKVRVVAENGYVPTTGVIQPDLDWSSPPVAGEVYELHGSVEPWEEMNDLINTALKRCYVTMEIAVDAQPGNTRHGLNVAAPWLHAASHVRRVGYLTENESRNRMDPYQRRIYGEPIEDEGKIYFDHWPQTFDHYEVLFVQLIKPAFNACRADDLGVFGDIDGLAADDNEAPVAQEWIVAAALVEYWERYASQLPEGDPQGKAAEDRQIRWAAAYDTLTAKYLRLPPRNFRSRPLTTGLGSRW